MMGTLSKGGGQDEANKVQSKKKQVAIRPDTFTRYEMMATGVFQPDWAHACAPRLAFLGERQP